MPTRDQPFARLRAFTMSIFLVAGTGLPILAAPALVAGATQPSEVWVDDSYCATAGCTTSDGHTLGVDAFRNINAPSWVTASGDALTAVASGGTIHVAAGTYLAPVSITKPVTLLGPQVGVEPTGAARDGGEAKLLYGPEPQYGRQGVKIGVNASDVTVSGFEFADNGYGIAVAQSEARANLVFSYNWFHSASNIGQVILGQNVSNYTGWAKSLTDVTVAHNRIEVTGYYTGQQTSSRAMGLSGSWPMTRLAVTDNYLSNTVELGWSLFHGGVTANYQVDDFTFARNTIVGGAMNIGNIADGTIADNTFSAAATNSYAGAALGIDNTGIDVALDASAGITGNTFANAGSVASNLKLWGTSNSSGGTFNRPSKNVAIRNNDFAGSVQLNAGIDLAGVVFSENGFAAPGDILRSEAGGTLAAENNWWGAPGGAIGASFSEWNGSAWTAWTGVDASPWIGAFKQDGTKLVGFWPMDVISQPVVVPASSEPETVDLPFEGLGTPSLGITAAEEGATVTVEPVENPVAADDTPFAVSASTVFVDIEAPGTFGPYTVCLDGSAPAKLYHYEGGAAGWVDITWRAVASDGSVLETPLDPADFPAGHLCGMTMTLSPFVSAGEKDTLTVTPDPKSVTYGEAAPEYTFTLKDGETAVDPGTLTGYVAPTCDATYAAGDPAGTYPISCSGGGSDLYDFDTTATADLSAGTRALTITADATTLTYGAAAPAFTFADDLWGSDTFATAPSCTSDYAKGDPAGDYDITCSGANAGPNYTSPYTYVKATLTVTPRGLTVTAADKTITYGDPAPTYTFTTTGFYGSDTWTSAPSCTSDYVQGDDAGDYQITCSGGTAPASYTTPFTYSTTGTLHVGKRALTVKADNKSIGYSGNPPTYTFSLTGSLYGSDAWAPAPSCTSTYTVGKPAGTYPITCTGGDAGTNYTVTNTAGTLTVDPLALGADDVWYTGQTFYYTKSASDTAAQVTLSASVNADLTCTEGGPSVAAATATFTDKLTGKVFAKGVPISPVAGDCSTGTATAFATLSAGTNLATTYVIVVTVSGSISGSNNGTGGQVDTAITTTTVTVSTPPPSAAGLYGSGELGFIANTTTIELGTEGSLTSAMVGGDKADLTFAFTYKKGTTPKGQAILIIPGPDGSFYYVKTNSVTSVTSSLATKTATVYAKASIWQVPLGCVDVTCQVTIDGNVSIRLDITDTGDLAGLTITSSKTSALYYSNDWFKSGKVWATRQEALAGTGKYVCVN